MINFDLTYLIGSSANFGFSIVTIQKRTKLSQSNAGAFLFGFIQRLAFYEGSYRFLPCCFQVQLNSNLSLSFITLIRKVRALIYSINTRPCNSEGLITTDRAVGKKRMSEKRDLN